MTAVLPLAQRIAVRFAAFWQVEAIALGGSRAAGTADEASDIDLYVYLSAPLRPDLRAALIAKTGEGLEIDNRFWETGDQWRDRDSGLEIDVMYRDTAFIEDALDRVLVRHEASLGYTTALWWNVRSAEIVMDRDGWFHQLKARAETPYPAPLKGAILAKNHPVLRTIRTSYREQIAVALARGDRVSVNHRLAALFASYFDILFAVNEQPHPGEKRLIETARACCSRLPAAMAEQVGAVLDASGDQLLVRLDALLDGLDRLLEAEHLLPVR